MDAAAECASTEDQFFNEVLRLEKELGELVRATDRIEAEMRDLLDVGSYPVEARD